MNTKPHPWPMWARVLFWTVLAVGIPLCAVLSWNGY